jgi:hypothetical protein
LGIGQSGRHDESERRAEPRNRNLASAAFANLSAFRYDVRGVIGLPRRKRGEAFGDCGTAVRNASTADRAGGTPAPPDAAGHAARRVNHCAARL